jgi:hypothetical protein
MSCRPRNHLYISDFLYYGRPLRGKENTFSTSTNWDWIEADKSAHDQRVSCSSAFICIHLHSYAFICIHLHSFAVIWILRDQRIEDSTEATVSLNTIDQNITIPVMWLSVESSTDSTETPKGAPRDLFALEKITSIFVSTHNSKFSRGQTDWVTD